MQRAETQRGDEPILPAVTPVQHRPEIANVSQRLTMKTKIEERFELSLPPFVVRLVESLAQFVEPCPHPRRIRRVTLGTRNAGRHRIQIAAGGFPILQQRLKYRRSAATERVEDHPGVRTRRQMFLNEPLREHGKIRTDRMKTMSHVAALIRLR